MMVNFMLRLFRHSYNFLMCSPEQQHLSHLLKMPAPGPHLRLTESETLAGAPPRLSPAALQCERVSDAREEGRGRARSSKPLCVLKQCLDLILLTEG